MTIQSFVRSPRPAVLLFLLILLVTSGTAWRPPVRFAPADLVASKVVVSPPPARLAEVPYDLISQDSLFGTLQDLTSIQPYSGWRSAATRGEAEALDYVAQRLSRFTTLREWGIELERQSFNVFMSTEFWETRLQLTVDGSEFEAPAEGLRGSRWSRKLALMMDSDGVLNDIERDPLVASGPVLLIQDEKQFVALKPEQVKGKVIFLDYALVDTIVEPDALDNSARLVKLIDQEALGLVLVSQFSTTPGKSHGTLAGDGSVFQNLEETPKAHIPILHARMEDLSSAGINGWNDLVHVQSARMVWDTDVLSPAQSGSLIARIPGLDSSRAVILGAHIDSPNNPGAMDNGSGSAALFEVARVLNESQIRPAVDLYLAWFGGHELGGYGSAYFVSTHQELLDRSLAMLQVDCLGHPQDGRSASISVVSTSYDRYGDERLLWQDYLSNLADSQGIPLDKSVEYGLIADNSNFDAFNVPNVDLIYFDQKELTNRGNTYIHYSMHWHDPYDTVKLAREVGDVLVDMTKVALAVALETGRNSETLRVAPQPERGALFLASHTETVTIGTSMLRDLGMALAWEGFDVDLIPYGQALSQADLENVDVIVLLPTMDYPRRHNETWREEELALLENYVRDGGFLVIANSSNNYVMLRRLEDPNEEARDLNTLLEAMGIHLAYGDTGEGIVRAVAEHPLMKEASYLIQYPNNGVPIQMKSGKVLARSEGMAVIGLLDYGSQGGQVLVIADLGLLQVDDSARNLEFIRNIAQYARWRKNSDR
jgi:hypothetical protein